MSGYPKLPVPSFVLPGVFFYFNEKSWCNVYRNAVCSTSGGNASDEGLGHGADESPTTGVRQARQLHSDLH